MDLKDLKQILEEEVVTPMDHRFLNYEVPPFDRIIPTAENVAAEIWRRLDPRIGQGAKLAKVRLFETTDLYVDVMRGGGILVQAEDKEHERQMRYRFGAGSASIGANAGEEHSRRPDIPQVTDSA